MLQLWLSVDRKTNTQKAFSLLKEGYQKGCEGQILMVPEQFSHATQQAFCRYCGDAASKVAEVLDFTRLAERVFSLQGGIADTRTDQVGQLLMMALAAEQVRSRLKVYGAGCEKPEFLLQLIRMTEEFRSFCISPDALRRAAAQETGVLAQKAEEFALLMESYEAVCENCGQNPKSTLTRLLDSLQEGVFGRELRIFFDGYTDFNGVQSEIIEELLCHGVEVHIFLQCDDLRRGGQQFEAARDTAQQLLSICAKAQEECCTHYLQPDEAAPPALRHLRQHLFGGREQVFEEAQENVYFIEGGDVLSQCRAVAGEILRLISGGLRFRDITVACADYENYRPVIASLLQRAQIPAYFAGDRDILQQGAVHMLLSALEAATGYMEQETVLAYLKSGYAPASRPCCDRLENYILKWNIRGSQFEQQWTMHPEGLGKQMDHRAQEQLRELNQTAAQAIAPLNRLRKQLRTANHTGEMVLRLYDFMEQIRLEEALRLRAEQCREMGELQKAQEYVQLYGILCSVLEQMHGVLGSSVRSPEAFCDIFRTALSQCSVGTIPAKLDCVSVGNIMSQRRSDGQCLFLLGASEGCFPGAQTVSSLLTDPERSRLMHLGLQLSPTAIGRLERELAAIDSVLEAAEKRLYLGAAEGSDSYFLRRGKALFPNAPRCRDDGALISYSHRDYLNYLADCGDGATDGPVEEARALAEAGSYVPENLSAQAVQALYGKTLHLSSTKVDELAGCRLAYFLKYGLGAKERKTAQVDPSLYGTFVHDVLEKTGRQVMDEGGFCALSAERTLEIAEGYMEAYAREVLGDLWQSARAEYLFRRNFAEVRDVVRELHRELSQSQFAPKWFELHFSGREGDLPAVHIAGQRMTAELEGYVDRADLWRRGDRLYVRVVDYKTGKKSLDYGMLLNGLGLQMLLYLFTLQREGQLLTDEALYPAGVLYFPARAERISAENGNDFGSIEKALRDSRKRSGLLLEDRGVLQAMEPCEEAPELLPYGYSKEGELQGDLATPEELARLAEFVFRKVAQLGDALYEGQLQADPYYFDENKNACRWCPYGSVCRSNKTPRLMKPIKSPDEFWAQIEEVQGNG